MVRFSSSQQYDVNVNWRSTIKAIKCYSYFEKIMINGAKSMWRAHNGIQTGSLSDI